MKVKKSRIRMSDCVCDQRQVARSLVDVCQFAFAMDGS